MILYIKDIKVYLYYIGFFCIILEVEVFLF